MIIVTKIGDIIIYNKILHYFIVLKSGLIMTTNFCSLKRYFQSVVLVWLLLLFLVVCCLFGEVVQC